MVYSTVMRRTQHVHLLPAQHLVSGVFFANYQGEQQLLERRWKGEKKLLLNCDKVWRSWKEI